MIITLVLWAIFYIYSTSLRIVCFAVIILPYISLVVAMFWLLNFLWTCLAELPITLDIYFLACSNSSSSMSIPGSDLSSDFVGLSSLLIARRGDSSVSILGILISSYDLLAYRLSDNFVTLIPWSKLTTWSTLVFLYTLIPWSSYGIISWSRGGSYLICSSPKV